MAGTQPIQAPAIDIEPAEHARGDFDARVRWHPHFVLRIGGEPVAAARALRSGLTAAAHDRLGQARAQARKDAAAACALIEAAVAQTDERTRIRNLLQLKRDLFNLRLPQPSLLTSLGPYIDEITRGPIEAVTELAALEDARTCAYQGDLDVEAAVLRGAAVLPNLRAALRASSPPLDQAIRKLEAGETPRRKDMANLYLGLSSFLTRATLKTSPKSSLTLVALGTWDQQGGADTLALALNDIAVRRDVRLRESVIERALRPLLASASRLASHTIVTANPTILIVGELAEWQRIAWSETPESETFGIAATTNRVRLAPGLLGIVRDLASAPMPRTLVDYAGHLRTHFDIGEAERIDALIERLVSLDLLVLRNENPQQGEILDRARSVAASLRRPLADEIAKRLDELAAARPAMVEPVLDELLSEAGASVRAAQMRPILHEDCVIESPAIRLHRNAVGDLRTDLADLLMLLPLLRGYSWASAWVTRHFVAQFGTGGQCRDPIAFLTATAELMAAPSEDPSAAPPWHSDTVPDDPDALALDTVSSDFADALRDRNAGTEDWTIPGHLVRRFFERIPASYRRRARSHCINGQFLMQAGARHFLVNAVYPGNARMTSRFLDHGDAVSAYLDDLAPGRTIAIPGVFGFNANRHPRLCDSEISIPLYPADFAGTDHVPVHACRLRHDPRRNQLVLEGPAGERLNPYYFGILNSWALPPVHRLLDWTNGATDLPFSIGSGVFARERGPARQQIQTRPRLRLGKLVLARRTHRIAIEALPDPTMSDLAFYVALRDTWRTHDLPPKAFFHASNTQSSRPDGDPRPVKARKPMYLDIDSVWLVKAFQRALRNMRGHVSITEVLPEPGDTPVSISGEPHTAEITIELGVREADV
ncbi:hypothetical protein RZN05_03620 [Sphingomonas sp. HF-S4]|uniref:Lantibiotic dehydratase N-terminal domain-containing protein n=1 Tax=Sphingomonas agrestis TaxID=3080540 RepID=A0ABU3Y3Y4_9SPHN|nr:lantibiotic dehydratase [Sphingomonas sp. HF-S4]MDV3456058.1 hypothetical protein [Sphingomonas sp. HF-S4]